LPFSVKLNAANHLVDTETFYIFIYSLAMPLFFQSAFVFLTTLFFCRLSAR